MTTTFHYPPLVGERARRLADMHGADLGDLDLSLLGPERRWFVIERFQDETWARLFASREDAHAGLDSAWDLLVLVDLVTGDTYDKAGRYLGVTVFERPLVPEWSFGDVVPS